MYNPNIPPLITLATRRLYGFCQDTINLALTNKSAGNPKLLTVEVELNENDAINATMTLPPIVELLPSPEGSLMVNIHLDKFLSGSKMMLNGTAIDLDRWSFILRGPLIVESIADMQTLPPGTFKDVSESDKESPWKVKLGPSSNLVVVAANKLVNPPISPSVEADFSYFTELMKSYWDGLVSDSNYDFAYVSWPATGPTPLLCYSAWKSYADGSISPDGSIDGVDRPLNTLFSSIVSNGGDQLILIDCGGPSLPVPKNWVPLDDGAVFMIACEEFLLSQVQYAIDNALPPDRRFDMFDRAIWSVDMSKPMPYWPLSVWGTVEEPSAMKLLTLNFEDKRWLPPAAAPKSPDIDILTNMTMTCTKSNTITLIGDLKTPLLSPVAHYQPIVDIVLQSLDVNGILTFLPNGGIGAVVPLSKAQGTTWLSYLDSTMSEILRFTAFNAALAYTGKPQSPIYGPPLPGIQFYSMFNATISAASFDFSASISIVLPRSDE